MAELKGIHYDAFISYRHCELDSFVAENLHKKLESFKLPRSVRSKVKSGKTKITRVFRDVDELPLSEDLSDPINNALANTDFLITICTPRYPLSRWCMKEIEVFLQTHTRDHILVVLAEDEPYNSFPEILNFEDVEVRDENGEVHIEKREIEPLAADTRGANKREILKAMDTAVLKLCAAIFGLNYDDLKQRHREAKIKKLATIFGSIGAAVLLFAIFATVMLIKISRQNVLISNQYAELQDKYAGSMAAASEKLMSVGRRKDAIYALRSVLPDNKEDGYNVEVLKDLYATTNVYGSGKGFVPKNTYDMSSEIYYSQVSPDGKYILLNDYYGICIFDVETGDMIMTLEAADSDQIIDAVLTGNGGILIGRNGNFYYRVIGSSEETAIPGLEDTDMSVYDLCDAVSEDVTVIFSDDILYGIDNSGTIAFTIDVGEQFGVSDLSSVDFCFDEGKFAVSFTDYDYYYLVVADSKTDEVLASLWNTGDIEAKLALEGDFLYFSTFRMTATTGDTDSKLYAINYTTGQTMWIADIGESFIHGIVPNGDYIYAYDNETVYVFFKKYGTALNYYMSNNNISKAFPSDDYLCYLCQDGKVFFCNDLATFEYTDSFYNSVPHEYVYDSYYMNGDLYLQFRHANYIVRYTTESGDIMTGIEYEPDYDDSYSNSAYDVLDNYPEINQKLVDSSFFSDDEKYIFVIYSNYTAQILDASTGKIIKSLILEDLTMNRMIYSNITNGYILLTDYSASILNDSFDIICKTPYIYGEMDGKFIMIDNNAEYCTAPYIGYDELIKKADEMLAGYEPTPDIKDKYNMK